MLARLVCIAPALAGLVLFTAVVADNGAIPSQDSIEIDPSGGKIAVSDGTKVGQGGAGILRDDVGLQDYYICDLTQPVRELSAVAYALDDDGANHHVLLQQSAPLGSGGLIQVWVDGRRVGDAVGELCDHAASSGNVCVKAGMPGELWGDIGGGLFYWQDKETGQWSSEKIRIHLKPKKAKGLPCG